MFDFQSLLLAQTDVAEGPRSPVDYVEGSYWFPQQASTFAKDVDFLFYAIFYVCALFFIGIIVAMVYFVIKYRRRPGHTSQPSPSHNTALEIAWSILPGFILIWFFVEGANGWFYQKIVPTDAEEINVIASQFNWEFVFPDGDTGNELHLVVNRPAKFVLESRDVLHSFFIPAFRVKQDIVPGRYTEAWVKPIKPGTFRLYCAEYCGDEHSLMKTKVIVHASEEERKAATLWEWGKNETVKNGERIFAMKCSGCHRPDELQKTGPGLGALAGMWGKERPLAGGGTVLVDDNYVRSSLLDPNAHIADGFTKPSQMTSFQGTLTEDQIFWLRAYIKSLANVEDDAATARDATLGQETDPEGQPDEGDKPPTSDEAKPDTNDDESPVTSPADFDS